MHGLLIMDKEAGMTSHDVVQRLRRLLQTRKIGHTGTLDPFATGVLPICVGRATRLARHLNQDDKTYEATVYLGIATDTMDLEGETLETHAVPAISAEDLEAALAGFRGRIQQKAPMYSAVKVRGKALHRYARAGESVAQPIRDVEIYALELLEVTLPSLRLRVRCSKGTYVRSLADDLGRVLGVGGHLTALRRTQAGPYELARAVTLLELERRIEEGTLSEVLMPPVDMVPDFMRVHLSSAQAGRVRHGNPLELEALSLGSAVAAGDQVALCEGGTLLAVGEVRRVGKQGQERMAVQPRSVLEGA